LLRGRRGAASLPQRPKTGSWKKAGRLAAPRGFSLLRRPFATLDYTGRTSAEGVWGTRGPEFKSRRPDQKAAGNWRLSLRYLLGDRALRSDVETVWKSNGCEPGAGQLSPRRGLRKSLSAVARPSRFSASCFSSASASPTASRLIGSSAETPCAMGSSSYVNR
jgi:hypothetical protein